MKYLVSTRGETEWVKNVRANPNVKLGGHGLRAHGDPGRTAGADPDAYKLKAGKVVEGYFRELPDDADHPVFALTTRADHYTL